VTSSTGTPRQVRKGRRDRPGRDSLCRGLRRRDAGPPGTVFTNESAIFGNDLSTLPNFPAEIRAPAGTLAGVVRLPGPHL